MILVTLYNTAVHYLLKGSKSGRFVSYTHQDYIYLIKNTFIFWNSITIQNICFLLKCNLVLISHYHYSHYYNIETNF